MAATIDQSGNEFPGSTGPGSSQGQIPTQAPGDQYGRIPQTPYRFTAEEMRVLRQCNKESFYQRSLPIGTFLGIGTYYGVKSGYLKPNPRWGPTPKVMLAVTIGYFLGKVSYQSVCAQKIMELPNSPLGAAIRKRRQQGKFQESLSLDPSFGAALPPFGSSYETYSDVSPKHDIDERPYQAEGLDDSFRPTVDTPIIEEEPLPPAQSYTSYEELRRKNREDYDQKRKNPYRSLSQEEAIRMRTGGSPPAIGGSIPARSTGAEKNKYGDVWDG